jgi:hypothetical protein
MTSRFWKSPANTCAESVSPAIRPNATPKREIIDDVCSLTASALALKNFIMTFLVSLECMDWRRE